MAKQELRQEGPFFGELYLRSTLPFLQPWATVNEARFLEQQLTQLELEGPVVDLGCGHGRHASILASRLSRPLVGLDMDALSLSKVNGRFTAVRGDLFALPFRSSSLAAAYAWYSTLFIFEDEHMPRLLAEIRRCLKVGGRLFFQTVPYEHASREGPTHYDGVLPDGSRLVERGGFNPTTKRDELHRELTLTDGRVLSASFFIRYYPIDELTRLLQDAGFSVMWMYGGLRGEPLAPTSRDLIVGVERSNG